VKRRPTSLRLTSRCEEQANRGVHESPAPRVGLFFWRFSNKWADEFAEQPIPRFSLLLSHWRNECLLRKASARKLARSNRKDLCHYRTRDRDSQAGNFGSGINRACHYGRETKVQSAEGSCVQDAPTCLGVCL